MLVRAIKFDLCLLLGYVVILGLLASEHPNDCHCHELLDHSAEELIGSISHTEGDFERQAALIVRVVSCHEIDCGEHESSKECDAVHTVTSDGEASAFAPI